MMPGRAIEATIAPGLPSVAVTVLLYIMFDLASSVADGDRSMTPVSLP